MICICQADLPHLKELCTSCGIMQNVKKQCRKEPLYELNMYCGTKLGELQETR